MEEKKRIELEEEEKLEEKKRIDLIELQREQLGKQRRAEHDEQQRQRQELQERQELERRLLEIEKRQLEERQQLERQLEEQERQKNGYDDDENEDENEHEYELDQNEADPYMDDPYMVDQYEDDPYEDDQYEDDQYEDDQYEDDEYEDDQYEDEEWDEEKRQKELQERKDEEFYDLKRSLYENRNKEDDGKESDPEFVSIHDIFPGLAPDPFGGFGKPRKNKTDKSDEKRKDNKHDCSKNSVRKDPSQEQRQKDSQEREDEEMYPSQELEEMFTPIVPLDFGDKSDWQRSLLTKDGIYYDQSMYRNEEEDYYYYLSSEDEGGLSDCSEDGCWIDCAVEEEDEENVMDDSWSEEDVGQPDTGPDLMAFSDSEETDLVVSKFSNMEITPSDFDHPALTGGGASSDSASSVSSSNDFILPTKKPKKSRVAKNPRKGRPDPELSNWTDNQPLAVQVRRKIGNKKDSILKLLKEGGAVENSKFAKVRDPKNGDEYVFTDVNPEDMTKLGLRDLYKWRSEGTSKNYFVGMDRYNFYAETAVPQAKTHLFMKVAHYDLKTKRVHIRYSGDDKWGYINDEQR